MKRLVKGSIAVFVAAIIAITVVVLVGPSTTMKSPYPKTLPLQRGMTFDTIAPARPWGTVLYASQAQTVTLISVKSKAEWGVWQAPNSAPTFPVRSIDGGAHWTIAGPLLASDWAGGSLYYITRVIPESSQAVIMVSNAVIDVTVDGGHVWYQYLHPASNWKITGQAQKDNAIELRVSPARFSELPEGSYATYVLDLSHLQWRRSSQSI